MRRHAGEQARREDEAHGRRHHPRDGRGRADHRRDVVGVRGPMQQRAADRRDPDQEQEALGPDAPGDRRAEGQEPDAVEAHVHPRTVQEGVGQRRPETAVALREHEPGGVQRTADGCGIAVERALDDAVDGAVVEPQRPGRRHETPVEHDVESAAIADRLHHGVDGDEHRDEREDHAGHVEDGFARFARRRRRRRVVCIGLHAHSRSRTRSSTLAAKDARSAYRRAQLEASTSTSRSKPLSTLNSRVKTRPSWRAMRT